MISFALFVASLALLFDLSLQACDCRAASDCQSNAKYIDRSKCGNGKVGCCDRKCQLDATTYCGHCQFGSCACLTMKRFQYVTPAGERVSGRLGAAAGGDIGETPHTRFPSCRQRVAVMRQSISVHRARERTRTALCASIALYRVGARGVVRWGVSSCAVVRVVLLFSYSLTTLSLLKQLARLLASKQGPEQLSSLFLDGESKYWV